MDKPFLGGIVVALAVIVAGGALLMAPRMQSPRDKVAVLAGADVERARRLMNQFSENEERIGVLLGALADAGVNPALKPEDVQRLIEEEEGRTVVEEQDARLKEVLRDQAAQAAPLEERFLQAAYGTKWQEHLQTSRPGLGANVSQMGSAIQEGLKERDRLIDENRQILREALQAAESALGQNMADASGDAEVDAHRLHGIILYHLGEAERRQADALRSRAAGHLNRLVSLGLEAKSLEDEKGLPGATLIDSLISEAEAKLAEAESEIAKAKASAGELESQIENLESRIASLRQEAETARGEMERMEEQGVRLDQPGGFPDFAAEFGEAAKRYRAAQSEIHRLESGSLRNARIDTSGDFVKGSYVPQDAGQPISPDLGLPGLQKQHADAELQVTAAQAALDSAQAEVQRLRAMRTEYQQRAADAESRLAQLAQAGQAAYDDFAKAAAESESAEEEAVKRYTKSVSAFNNAARLALDRVGEAEQAVATLSEEAKARRAAGTVAAEDTWLEQQFMVNAADAQIRLGSLYYRAWSDDERVGQALTDLPASLGLREVSPEAWREKATAARTAGTEVLHKAYDTIQNTRGTLKGHWTLAAEAAAAANLLALFGEEAMKDIAIAAYEGVVADQADKPYVQAYVDRLRSLRSTGGTPSPP